MKRNHLLFLLAVSVICLLNLNIGNTIMGFDNASPFHDPSITLYRIFDSGNFFHFGGIIFSPAFLLSFLPIPPWLISYVTYFGALFIAMYFAERIITCVNKQSPPWYIAVIILLGNLLPIWIFSIPLLIFVPSFAGIITFIYFLIRKEKSSLFEKILIIIGILYLASTSINVAAFFIYFVQAIIIALVIGNSSVNVLQRAGIFALSWLIITQLFVFIASGPRSIFEEAYLYGQDLLVDQKTELVTKTLADMEINRNSIINVARFATGWTKLTDASGDFLFTWGTHIDTLPILIVTIIPVMLVVYSLLPRNEAPLPRITKHITYIWIAGLLLSSTYFLLFARNIDGISFLLRWGSSKLWPLVYIPWILLYSRAVQNEMTNKIARYLAIGASTILILPWLIGIVTQRLTVELPPAYETVFSPLSKDVRVLYLPEPQRLYMRQYEWGYYGSSFLPYLSRASIYDQGIFHPKQNVYAHLVGQFYACSIPDLQKNVDIIIIDAALPNTKKIPACYNMLNRSVTNNLTVISL